MSAGLAGMALAAGRAQRAEAAFQEGTGPYGSDFATNVNGLTVGTTLYARSLGLGHYYPAPTARLTIDDDPSYMSFNSSGVEKVKLGYESGWSRFVYIDSGLGIYRLVVTSAGNVGIGTTGPVAKLDVAGTIAANGNVAIDAAGIAVRAYYAQ